jgi:hypothetical protein
MNLVRAKGSVSLLLLLAIMPACGAVSGAIPGRHLVSISVSPPFLCQGGTLPVPAGAPQNFTATGTFSDNTQQANLPVAWSTSDPSIATIDSTGTPACVDKGVQGRVTVFARAAAAPGTSAVVTGTAAFGCGGRFCP